jgi:hypothetical protein
MHAKEPFRQWGLDFIEEINPPSSDQHKWIFSTTSYFTKWVEAIPARNVIDLVVIKFMESRTYCPALGVLLKSSLIMHRPSNLLSSPTSATNSTSLLDTPLHTTLKGMAWPSLLIKLW